MKKILKEIVPPLLLKLLHRDSSPEAFSSYQDALVSSKNNTYEQDELIDVVLRKNAAYRALAPTSQTFSADAVRVLMAIGLARNGNKINVIDFGGGGGNHLTDAKVAFDNLLSFNWNIVETQRFVQESSKYPIENLQYFDDLSEAKEAVGDVDLLLLSSTLQYCPDPLNMLEQLTDLGAKYLYLTRTPFNSGAKTIYSVQSSWLSGNGPGPLPDGIEDRKITYPISYANYSGVEKVLNRLYEVKFKTDEGGAPAFQVKSERIAMTGYFCKLR